MFLPLGRCNCLLSRVSWFDPHTAYQLTGTLVSGLSQGYQESPPVNTSQLVVLWWAGLTVVPIFLSMRRNAMDDDISKLLHAAFDMARKSGKADWSTMTTAVLKNYAKPSST